VRNKTKKVNYADAPFWGQGDNDGIRDYAFPMRGLHNYDFVSRKPRSLTHN